MGREPPADEVSSQLATRGQGSWPRPAQVTPSQTAPLQPNTLRFTWRDAESYAKLPAEQRFPNRNNDSRMLAPSFQIWPNIDPQGKFECYAPAGRFQLAAPPYAGEQSVEITGPTEMEVNFTAGRFTPQAGAVPAQPRVTEAKFVELSGRVVLEADREHGIGGVNVRRIDLERRRFGPGEPNYRTATSADGTFKLMRPEADVLLLASTADNLLSAIVKLPASTNEAVIAWCRPRRCVGAG